MKWITRPILFFLGIQAKLILFCFGWKIIGGKPKDKKVVVIFAPHTSNWDFLWSYLGILSIGLRVDWVGKDSLFVWPLGLFMRLLGGIPVNRKLKTGFIQKIIDLFKKKRKLTLAIAPEGSRAKGEGWKSGFYYIAKGANVPILLSYIDYGLKEVGFSFTVNPYQNANKSMEEIRLFYQDKKGKHADQQNEIRFR